MIEATTPNSLRILLLVSINVANPDAVVRLVIKVAFPTLTITRCKDLAWLLCFAISCWYLLIKKIDNKDLPKEDIIKSLNDSGLKGKGGAGFPTGRKWELVLQNKGEKFIAINGDEGEPGTL